MAKIDLDRINREDFDVLEKDGLFLVRPKKSKHVWAPNELHLRSVVTDDCGWVLSTGLPKFRNYGECAEDDAAFEAALQVGAVEFVEKYDGSLIIVDVDDRGQVRFRTRGQHDLGAFEEPVMSLVREKYPRLLTWLPLNGFLSTCSLLFEFVSPDNQIVVRYAEPELVFLGAVWKYELTLLGRGFVEQDIERATGIKPAASHPLPTDPAALRAIVREWDDKEGVVARYVTNGELHLSKIKADQYVRLHALKFRLSGKVGRLLLLLDAVDYYDARQKLFDLGVDYEAQAFVQEEIKDYVFRRRDTAAALYDVSHRVDWLRAECQETDPRAARKQFVADIRKTLDDGGLPPDYFTAALQCFDGKHEEARVTILARQVVGEPVAVVREWLKDPQAAIDAMLNVPVLED